MNWPERKENTYKQDWDQEKSVFNKGYNAALEACRAAYEKESKLVALDELKLTEFLLPTYEDDSIDNVYDDDLKIATRKYIRVRSIVHDVCSKFGTPSLPTVDSISMITRDEWFKIMIPYHGGNPEPWAQSLDKIYSDYFDPKTHKKR